MIERYALPGLRVKTARSAESPGLTRPVIKNRAAAHYARKTLICRGILQTCADTS